MDTKKLYTLLETVKMGSLKKAAEKLNYTQSGMIYLMNSLEQEIGLNILARDYRGVTLNATGEALEPYFINILKAEEELRSKISEITNTKRGEMLRIGSCPSFASQVLPRAMGEFLREKKDVTVSLKVGSAELVKCLEDDEIDLAIVAQEPVGGSKKWVPLMEDEMYAAIPESLLPNPRHSITRYELRSMPMNFQNLVIGTPEESMPDNNDLQARVIVSLQDAMALLSMVGSGMGVAYISKMYLNLCPKNVRMIPLDPPFVRNLGVVVKTQKKANPLIDEFVCHLRGYCAEHT